jgi:integrase
VTRIAGLAPRSSERALPIRRASSVRAAKFREQVRFGREAGGVDPVVGDTRGLGGRLAAAAKKSGLPHVHPRMLRHSAAVRQAEAGVPTEEIASDLGHSKPERDTRDFDEVPKRVPKAA